MRRLVLVALAVLAAVSCGLLAWRIVSGPQHTAPVPERGLVATIRSEPRTFNRLVARDRASHLVSLLTQARLVRVNLATHALEPGLAERWEVSADARTYTFHLRPGVTFSDGAALTAADVEFSLRAVFDARTASPLASALTIGGRPPVVTVVDDLTLAVSFAEPFNTALRVLDSVPVLPAHKLSAALSDGSFRDAWSVTTPPRDLAGLGPFVLAAYVAGERLDFVRNERYWKRSERGERLPRLDRLTLLVVPDQNGEMLRLENGEADLVSSEARPEDMAALQRAQADGRLTVWDVGVGLDPDLLWFNLSPRAHNDPARAWLTHPALRQAISLGVDRRAFADVVYLGNAEPVDSPITPGNREWFDAGRPRASHDPRGAAEVLEAAGLIDRDRDGTRERPDGRPARFTIVTQKGNLIRERAAVFLQGQLAALGLSASIVALEAGALVERITTGAYDAAWFGVVSSDTDPGTHLDFWLSSGSFHLWNPGQRQPATDWEARIDGLMSRFVSSMDHATRRSIFRDVQREFDAARPALYFVAPRIVVATSRRVANVRPALLQPSVLWDAEELRLESAPR